MGTRQRWMSFTYCRYCTDSRWSGPHVRGQNPCYVDSLAEENVHTHSHSLTHSLVRVSTSLSNVVLTAHSAPLTGCPGHQYTHTNTHTHTHMRRPTATKLSARQQGSTRQTAMARQKRSHRDGSLAPPIDNVWRKG